MHVAVSRPNLVGLAVFWACLDPRQRPRQRRAAHLQRGFATQCRPARDSPAAPAGERLEGLELTFTSSRSTISAERLESLTARSARILRSRPTLAFFSQ